MDDDDQLPLHRCNGFGLKIKLRISPKSFGGDRERRIGEDGGNRRNEVVEESMEVEKQEVRVCDFCGKTFGSGKALGGHRRIHLYGGDRQIQKAKKTRVAGESPDRDLRRTCCICGKVFPSEKSLFGHMRFHPERSWRGVKPPCSAVAPPHAAVSNKHSSSSSTISDEEVLDREETVTVDLIGSLSGWARKDRRGKKSTYQEPSDSSDHHEDQTDDIDNDCTVPDGAAAHSLLHLSRGKKAKIEYVHEHEHESPRSLRCVTCDRSFASFQALGGHMSSHAKINGGESTSSDQRQQCGDDNSNMQEHKCKVCDRSFSSGQALGGHQRSHWAAGPETTAFCGGNGRGGLVIDLNQLPDVDEEDIGGGAHLAFNPGMNSN